MCMVFSKGGGELTTINEACESTAHHIVDAYRHKPNLRSGRRRKRLLGSPHVSLSFLVWPMTESTTFAMHSCVDTYLAGHPRLQTLTTETPRMSASGKDTSGGDRFWYTLQLLDDVCLTASTRCAGDKTQTRALLPLCGDRTQKRRLLPGHCTP